MLDNRYFKIRYFYVLTGFPASYSKVTDSDLGPAASYTKVRNIYLNYFSWYLQKWIVAFIFVIVMEIVFCTNYCKWMSLEIGIPCFLIKLLCHGGSYLSVNMYFIQAAIFSSQTEWSIRSAWVIFLGLFVQLCVCVHC